MPLLTLLLFISATLAADVKHGETLAHVAGCGACHLSPEGQAFAGGYGITTRYGVYYGSNLTPHPEHGLGGWTQADFDRAVHKGKSPSGRRYWPAFPFPSFTQLSASDRADLFAYLQGLEPVDRANTPHALKGVYQWRVMARFWRLLAFRPQDFSARPSETPEQTQGRYWVDAVAHCAECHSPRNGIGALISRQYLGGQDEGPEPAPNISPRALKWTVNDWQTFLEIGMTAEGDFVGGEMRRVVQDGTARLSKLERQAMAEYLVSVAPTGDEPPPQPEADDDW